MYEDERNLTAIPILFACFYALAIPVSVSCLIYSYISKVVFLLVSCYIFYYLFVVLFFRFHFWLARLSVYHRLTFINHTQLFQLEIMLQL